MRSVTVGLILESILSIDLIAAYKSSEYLKGIRSKPPYNILVAKARWLDAWKGGLRETSS